jgi:hypothetical protein
MQGAASNLVFYRLDSALAFQEQKAWHLTTGAELALWDEIRQLFYERVQVIRYGDLHGLRAMQVSVKALNEGIAFPCFHNIWLDR